MLQRTYAMQGAGAAQVPAGASRLTEGAPAGGAMTIMMQFDQFQKLNKDNLDAAMRALGTVSKGGQAIAMEVADFGKQAFAQGTATLEKLSAARSFENVLEIQTEYAKASYEGLVARSTKIGELVTALSRDSVKTFEQAAAGASTTATA